MKRKIYLQPRIKVILMPQLLQTFEVSGEGGNAEEGVAKVNTIFEEQNEEDDVWKSKW